MTLLKDPGVASVLAEARQAHVAVKTTKGPHVTPQLYTVDGSDLWFFAAASTVKAKALRKRPYAGALVRAGTSSVALMGRVTSFDSGDPGTLVGGAHGLPHAARALAGYAVRNAPDLMGFARDAVRRRTGGLVPTRRVLFRLTPTAVALLEDDAVVARWGEWPSGVEGDVDVEQHPLAADKGTAGVAAWLTSAGPLAVPARWDDSTSSLSVPTSVVDLAPPTSTAASVVLDQYGGSGPSPKQGTLLRGEGELRRDDGSAVITLDPATVTTWDGVGAQTTKA